MMIANGFELGAKYILGVLHILFLFCSSENPDIEWLSNLPKVTELVSGGVRI